MLVCLQQVPETDWSPCRKVVGDTEVTITGFDPTQPILVRLFATSGTGMSNPVYALVNPGCQLLTTCEIFLTVINVVVILGKQSIETNSTVSVYQQSIKFQNFHNLASNDPEINSLDTS